MSKRSGGGSDMYSKRQVTFKTKNAEEQGFMILDRLRKPFSYLGKGRYIISKEQCVLLKSNKIPYKIKRYYS